METWKDMIDALGGIQAVANATGVGYNTAKHWYRRNSVPQGMNGKHWNALITYARTKGMAIGADDLLRLKRGRQSLGKPQGVNNTLGVSAA